jgi:hypothetical protein
LDTPLKLTRSGNQFNIGAGNLLYYGLGGLPAVTGYTGGFLVENVNETGTGNLTFCGISSSAGGVKVYIGLGLTQANWTGTGLSTVAGSPLYGDGHCLDGEVLLGTASVLNGVPVDPVDGRAVMAAAAIPAAGADLILSGNAYSLDRVRVPLKWWGGGAPGLVSGSLGGDLYRDNVTGNLYVCNQQPSTPCSGVNASNWVQINQAADPVFYNVAVTAWSEQALVGGSATVNDAFAWRFTLPRNRAVTQMMFESRTVSGGGIRFKILSADRSTVVCDAQTAYAGAGGTRDLATVGSKIVGFTGGTMVSSGSCQLPAGSYYLAYAADSTFNAVIVNDVYQMNVAAVRASGGACYKAGARTGSGASVDFGVMTSCDDTSSAEVLNRIPVVALF